MFALFTILPLLLFILMSNEGLPRLLDFSHIWGYSDVNSSFADSNDFPGNVSLVLLATFYRAKGR